MAGWQGLLKKYHKVLISCSQFLLPGGISEKK